MKFKPRRQNQEKNIPSGIRVTRTYSDFLLFCHENSIQHHVELDTVIGRIGGKGLLTISKAGICILVNYNQVNFKITIDSFVKVLYI